MAEVAARKHAAHMRLSACYFLPLEDEPTTSFSAAVLSFFIGIIHLGVNRPVYLWLARSLCVSSRLRMPGLVFSVAQAPSVSITCRVSADGCQQMGVSKWVSARWVSARWVSADGCQQMTVSKFITELNQIWSS